MKSKLFLEGLILSGKAVEYFNELMDIYILGTIVFTVYKPVYRSFLDHFFSNYVLNKFTSKMLT